VVFIGERGEGGVPGRYIVIFATGGKHIWVVVCRFVTPASGYVLTEIIGLIILIEHGKIFNNMSILQLFK
jgi:hypothetical protein